jgi:hypothetical protein
LFVAERIRQNMMQANNTSPGRKSPKNRGKLLNRAKKSVVATAAIGCGVGIIFGGMSGPPAAESAATPVIVANETPSQSSFFKRRADRKDQQTAEPVQSPQTPRLAANEPARDSGAVSVPASLLKHPTVPAFKETERSSISLSPEIKAVLGINDSTAAAVEGIIERARTDASSQRWGAAQVFHQNNTTVVDVPPEQADAGLHRLAELRGSLASVLGNERSDYLLKRAKKKLNWEFGGFGAFSQVIEVVPRSTGYVIRESLRRPLGSAPKGMEKWESEQFENFEFSVKEYRASQLPERIEKALAGA